MYEERNSVRAGIAVVLTAIATVSCTTPRIEDQPAADDALKQIRQVREPLACDHPIELLRRRTDAIRPFRQVATLSTTCSPGAPSVCERQLLERACHLGADAVILDRPSARAAGWNTSTQTLASKSARAIRWTD